MKKHPVRVDTFDGSLQKLAQSVCRMRYDKVSLFFGYCAVELLRQSNADFLRGRKLLAIQLTAAAGMASALQKKMENIFRMCIPHMHDEVTDADVLAWRAESEKTYWWRASN